jgi:hypothetical protein
MADYPKWTVDHRFSFSTYEGMDGASIFAEALAMREGRPVVIMQKDDPHLPPFVLRTVDPR